MASPKTKKKTAALFKPVKKTKVYEEIVAKIKEMIEKGQFKTGDRLPVERELAEVFRVSRSSVREAIRSLETQGFLESRQGDGTYIAMYPVESLVNTLATEISSQKDGQIELFEMRRIIEPQLAYLAAERATDEEIVQMEKTLSLQKQQVLRGESGAEADKQFHHQLAAAARNRFLLQIVESSMDFFMESRDCFLQVDGRPEKSIRRHRELLDSIEVRDPEGAAQVMREHLTDIEDSLFKIDVGKAGGGKQVS